MAEAKHHIVARQIVLKRKADGFPTTDCFELKTAAVPELKDGGACQLTIVVFVCSLLCSPFRL